MTPIAAAFNELQAGISALHELTGELTTRLEPVLRPPEPQPCPGESKKDGQLVSPIAERIRQLTMGVSEAHERLLSILRRADC